MHYKIVVHTLLVLTFITYVYSNIHNNINVDGEKPTKNKRSEWKFKDYLQKFRPKTVWDKIDMRRKLNSENITVIEQFNIMMNGIDETDELMRLKVADINTNVFSDDTRRQYRPPGGLVAHAKDPFELRYRIFELMKNAIYQARNRMVLMQTMRAKYKDTSLYKMGYLFSKTDTTVKTFSKVSNRAYKSCSASRQSLLSNHPMINIMQSEERMLNLWFDVELLTDLIILNDANMKKLIDKVDKGLKNAWKFVDKK